MALRTPHPTRDMTMALEPHTQANPGQVSMVTPAVASKPGRPSWLRFVPLAVLAVAIAGMFATGLHKHLTLENVVSVRDRFQSFIVEHKALAVLAYIATYTVAVAISVPGSALLTLTGGLMFGWLLGGVSAAIAASIGAILVFLIARSAFGEGLAAKAGPIVAQCREGFKANAMNYLLFLRLVPAFPFFLVNLAAAVLGVPLRTYVIGTLIGILPATFAIASVGAGLDSVVVAAKADYAACIAAKGANTCHLTINAGSLLTTELKIAFVLLGVVALLPVAYRKWGERIASAR
jgi:uncharacterized membrane protein YdjX (TVP38/TMEM64 family)